MPIETDVTTLDPDTVAQFEEQIRQVLEDKFDSADLSRGTALFDLLIRPAAIYHALNAENGIRYRKSSSLKEISLDPTMAEDDIVDNVLSNFTVARSAGQKAGGNVTIILSSKVTTPITTGTRFTTGTLSFVTITSFIGVTDSSLVAKSTDRVIKEVDGGLFSFDIEVLAEEEGEASQLTQGNALTIGNAPPSYVRSFVTFDFFPGATEETNEQLIDRLAAGVAGKTLSSRLNVEALIREQFTDVASMSEVGFQDPDMRRDAHNIFEESHGGKSDYYVQTQARPRITRIRKEATLVNKSTNTWQITMSRDDQPGFYKLSAIITDGLETSGLGSLVITAEVRTFNNIRGDLAFSPNMESFSEAAFSRFQEITYQFTDPHTDASTLTDMVSKKEYIVDVLGMSNIAEIQAFVSDRTRSAHRYDDLVRAPIPVLVSATVTIKLKPGETINEEAIKSAVSNRVNSLGFRSTLSASFIIDEIHDLLPTTASVVVPIDMGGELILPNEGPSILLRSSNTLIVATDHQLSVSEDTVMFFMDPADLAIEIQVRS